MFGYRKELEKYEDVDEDELLASLTAEELQELERELGDIEPDNSVPIGLRQKNQTVKTPTGTFSREALMKYWEKETRKLLEDERMGCTETQEDQTEEGCDDRVDSSHNEEICVTESNSEASEEEEEEEEIGKDNMEEETDQDESEQEVAVTEEEEENEEQESQVAIVEESTQTPAMNLNNPTKYREDKLVKNYMGAVSSDTNLKVTPDRPCGNPTVVDETLEQILSDDADTTEVNLNNIENISQGTLIRFAEALQINTHVQVFSLANTKADDQVAYAIARMVRDNKSITSINIESNFITGKGIVAMARALQDNNTITELRFHNQRHILGGQAEMEIVKLLRENSTLLKLGYQFDLPGPRMTMTGILTRNQDRRRQRRLQEQRLQCGPDGPANPRTSALQKGTPTGSPFGSPQNSPWSSPKLPHRVPPKKNLPPEPPLPPPPPPPPLPPPKMEKKAPTRMIAQVIKHQEQDKKSQLERHGKPKPKKGKKGSKKDEKNILKDLKNALRPVAEKRTEEIPRPSTPQRSAHDNLMAAIRNSSIKSLRQVEVPLYLR